MAEYFLPEPQYLQALAEQMLDEEMKWGADLTTQTLVSANTLVRIQIVAQEPAWVSGIPLVRELLRVAAERQGSLAPKIHLRVVDGTQVDTEIPVLEFSAAAPTVFLVQQSILNLLGHLSGITSHTKKWSNAFSQVPTVIRDTRDTLPGLRELEKYAVRVGGGSSSRLGLGTLPVITSHHWGIWLALPNANKEQKLGSEFLAKVSATDPIELTKPTALSLTSDQVGQAVGLIRNQATAELPVQVEVSNLDQLAAVVSVGQTQTDSTVRPTAILLKDFSPADLELAVNTYRQANDGMIWEAVGEYSLEQADKLAKLGLDYLGLGALTLASEPKHFQIRWLRTWVQ